MRIEPIGSYPWYLRPIFRIQRRRYGKVLDSAPHRLAEQRTGKDLSLV